MSNRASWLPCHSKPILLFSGLMELIAQTIVPQPAPYFSGRFKSLAAFSR
jgi:hypothetical protein